MAEKAGVTMSVEGFLLRRKRYRTKHNMFQLVSDDEHFDLKTAINLLKIVEAMEEESNEIWTLVPPGYRWELVK